MKHAKKLIEVALPLEAINKACAREKSIRHGHPSTLHLWWARRPLAAARAVIFAQMVDDPSSYPDLFPTVKKQEKERERLFRIIEDLVLWENTTNETVLQAARDEIWASWRRACAEKNQEIGNRKKEIGEEEFVRQMALFDPGKLPAFHDPFAGGGALPLEAQRLGLESYASDLNPVAVLINKAMIEIPPRFAGLAPVNPESRKQEIGIRRSRHDALQGVDRLAEGDGRGARGLSLGADAAQGGNVRDAIPDNASGSLDPVEHRRGLGAGVGQGEGTVSRDRSGLDGGTRHTTDPLRADRLVSDEGDGRSPQHNDRGGQDPDNDAQEPPRGVGNRNQEVGNRMGVDRPTSYLLFPNSYRGAEGLAADVRHYGQWMRDEAEKRIGTLYPKIEVTAEMAKTRPDLKPYVGQSLTVIAWLWARTVKSPNPAFAQVDVPLASTFMLSTKAGKEAYVEPVIENRGQEIGNSQTVADAISYPLSPTSFPIGNRGAGSGPISYLLSPTSSPSPSYRFTVKVGKPKDAEGAKSGTKLARANFGCLMSGTPVSGDYIKAEGKAGRMGARLMAVVAEGTRGRVYLAPTPEHEAAALKAKPTWRPEGDIATRMTGGNCTPYGLTTWGDLFTPRQLVALTTFSDLVGEAREHIRRDALAAGLPDLPTGQAGDPKPLRDGGTGATAYADAVGCIWRLR